MIVGGCKICKLDYSTYRDLLIHINEHCSNVFYINDDDNGADKKECYLNDEEEESDSSVVTPEPAASPQSGSPSNRSPQICRKTAPSSSSNGDKSSLLFPEERKDDDGNESTCKKVSKLLRNLSTAALINRPTMVEMDTTDNLLKNFVCTECDRLFDKAELYNDHLNIHIAQQQQCADKTDANSFREFKCIECDGFLFGDINAYRDHLHNAHGVENFSCTICDQQFGTTFELNRHMGAHSGGSYACRACGACFRTKRHLSSHRCCQGNEQQPIDFSRKLSSEKIDTDDDVIADGDLLRRREDTSAGNDYLEEILANTVSSRPKRARLARFKRGGTCKSKKVHEEEYCSNTKSSKVEPALKSTVCKLASKNDNNNVDVKDCRKNVEEKILGSYFLELVETNVCKYRHRGGSNGGGGNSSGFNCYLTKCMDMADELEVDKTNGQSSSQEV